MHVLAVATHSTECDIGVHVPQLFGFVGLWGVVSFSGDHTQAGDGEGNYVAMLRNGPQNSDFSLLVYSDAGRLPFLTHSFQLITLSKSAVCVYVYFSLKCS